MTDPRGGSGEDRGASVNCPEPQAQQAVRPSADGSTPPASLSSPERRGEALTVLVDTDLTGLHSDVYQIERDPIRWALEPTSRVEGNFIKECCSHVLTKAGAVLALPHSSHGHMTLPHADGECEAHRPSMDTNDG